MGALPLMQGRRFQPFPAPGFWLFFLVLAVSLTASRAAYAAFGLTSLHLNAAGGSEDYMYTAGNTIFLVAGVDNADAGHPGRSYRVVFSNPGGTPIMTFSCTPNGNPGTFTSSANAYTVQASDPASAGTGYSVTLNQFNNVTPGDCSGSPEKTEQLFFVVATASIFSDSGLTAR